MKSFILIMHKKYKKLDDIQASIRHLKRLLEHEYKVIECLKDLEILKRQEEEVKQDIEQSLTVLNGYNK